MLVVMQSQATDEQVRAVCEKIEAKGFQPHVSRGTERTVVAITGDLTSANPAMFEMPGVKQVIPISKAYKLVSREAKKENTLVRVPHTDLAIGGTELAVMAGPCSVETRENTFAIAEHAAAQGAKIFRGGAFKPRTSPYAFQGLGLEGLKILAEVRERYGLAIVTEAIDHESLDLVEEYADIIQLGTRNMQNFSLLRRAGRARKPVLLKRGMSATLDEFLMAAEYVMSEGNRDVILCERGVRTFAGHARNTLDLSVVPAVKRLSHLPIIIDPSHGSGRRDCVIPLARAGVVVGADGVIVEIHNDPDRALSDGQQSLYLNQFDEMMQELREIAPVVNRTVAEPRDANSAAKAQSPAKR